MTNTCTHDNVITECLDCGSRIIRQVDEVRLLQSALTTVQEENKRLVKLFESLTPSGSEFVGDTNACYSFVKDRLHTVMEVARERNELREENKRLRDAYRTIEFISKYDGKDNNRRSAREEFIFIKVKAMDCVDRIKKSQSALNGGK